MIGPESQQVTGRDRTGSRPLQDREFLREATPPPAYVPSTVFLSLLNSASSREVL